MSYEDKRYRLIIDNLVKIIETRKNRDNSITVVIDGKKYKIKVNKISENKLLVRVGKDEFTITYDDDSGLYFINDEPYRAKIVEDLLSKPHKAIKIPFMKKSAYESFSNCVTSPITGKIVSINVKLGEKINKGDLVAVIESMKIRNEIFSDKSGIVKKIYYSPGQIIKKGEKIIELE